MDLRLGRRGVAFAGLLFHVVAELCFTWMFGWGGGGQVPQGASGIAQAHVLAASTALVLRLGLLAADRQLVGSRGLLRFRNLRLVPWGAIAGEARRLLPLLLLSALGLVLVGSGLSGGARGASTSGLLAWLAGVAALVGAAVPLARIGYTVLGTASAVALVTILGPRALLLLATDGIVREHCIRPLPWVVALGLALGAGWAWWTARNEPGSARTLAEVPRMGSE
jgi:hypothetical protein